VDSVVFQRAVFGHEISVTITQFYSVFILVWYIGIFLAKFPPHYLAAEWIQDNRQACSSRRASNQYSRQRSYIGHRLDILSAFGYKPLLRRFECFRGFFANLGIL
jgi:hypothetical protein